MSTLTNDQVSPQVKAPFNLNEEEICGHLVTEKTKRLWAVELDLAQQLFRICEKHGIRCFAAGGTLLGAVRHKGFIPWDDDMDFLMMKDDYETFSRVAPQELEEPYAFQPTFSLSRIRNSNTTGCTLFEVQKAIPPYNLGIFIDIFPLTAIPDERRAQAAHKRALARMRRARYGQRAIEFDKYHNKLTWRSWLRPSALYWKTTSLFSHETLAKRYLDVCDKYNDGHTEQVGITSFLPYQERYIWNRSWFEGDPVYLPFENIKVPAPSHYDEVLRKSFGDYNVFVKDGAQHALPICEPDIPFAENELVKSMLADASRVQ